MSLVAYDNSDSEDEHNSSDNENETLNEEKVGVVEIITKPSQENGNLTNIFESLPQPQLNSHENVTEDVEDEFLNKKEVPVEKPKKQTIKISVPSLAEFDSDDDEIPVKKRKVIDKSCGLFALLPPPKTTQVTTKHFIPNAVKKNAGKGMKLASKVTPQVKKNSENKTTTALDSEDEDESDTKNLPDSFDDEIWQKVCGRKEKRAPKHIVKEPQEHKLIQLDPEVQKPYDGLDNLAFKELVGANSKRKGEAIDIVDINEDEIHADKKIWMTKSLTDPEMAPKYVVKNPVNDTCKRKHHITYLAQQAKANEQELQNQWASSRFTRQKSQAKYGF